MGFAKIRSEGFGNLWVPENFWAPVRVCYEAKLCWDWVLGWPVIVIVFTLPLRMAISSLNANQQNNMNNSKACECIQSKCKNTGRGEKLPSVIWSLLRLSRWYFSLVDSAVSHGGCASCLFACWWKWSTVHAVYICVIHIYTQHACIVYPTTRISNSSGLRAASQKPW